MEEMTAFTTKASNQFGLTVPEGDEAALREMLECIRDVKKLTKKNDNLIEPLRVEVQLL